VCKECMHRFECLVFSRTYAQLPKNGFTVKKNIPPRVPPPKNAHGSEGPPLDFGCHGGNPSRILRYL
jgi:hypothetical protein